MKKTAIYMRVSSDRQVQEGDSIPTQRDALRKYVADRPDLVLAGEYLDDGISGQKYSQRDELQRLLDDVRADKIDLIAFTKLDRWFRSVRHYTATQEILDKHGVAWLAIWEPIYDTTTPSGRLIVNQMMSIAQFEAENTGQRIRQVFDYKVNQGEVLSGSTPPGYSIKNKRLVPNENARYVAEAFELYARTGILYSTIRAFSHVKEIPNTNAAFKNMLSNRKYIGEFRGNPNYCEPLVSKELFEAVQVALKRNVKINQKRVYIFSGLIRCAECGTVMAGGHRVRHRENCKPYEASYYRCSKCWNRAVRLCDNKKTLTESVLERYLLGNIRPLINDVILEYELRQKPVVDNRKKIAVLEGKIRRLKDLYVDELIEIDEYKRDRAQLQGEIDALRDVSLPPERDLSSLKAFLQKDIEGLYSTFSDDEKRLFWRSIIKEIQFDKHRNISVFFF